MSFNLNSLANKVSIQGLNATQVLGILGKTVSFITLVEQMGEELAGNQKFQAVMAMVEGFLVQNGMGSQVQAVLQELGWVVNFIVKFYNFLNLWPKTTSSTAPASPPPPAAGA